MTVISPNRRWFEYFNTNGIELFNVFMFSPTLTLQSLFPFKLFCYAGVTDGGFANTTEVKAVERQHCTASETLSNSELRHEELIGYRGDEGI